MGTGGPHAERELARAEPSTVKPRPLRTFVANGPDLNLIQGENVLKERGVNAVLRLNGYPGIVIALRNAGIVSELAQPNVCDVFAALSSETVTTTRYAASEYDTPGMRSAASGVFSASAYR